MLALKLDYLLTQVSGHQENIVFAPINIVKTLGTIMLGAGGETERELALVLGLAVGKKLINNIPELHKEMGVLLTKVTTENPGVTFGTNINIAGGVFIQRDTPVCTSYLNLVRSIYRTEVTALDFYNGGYQAANYINRWIAKKTNNKITNIIEPPIARDTKVLFAGSLYFNGDWEFPFPLTSTRVQSFYLGSEGKRSKESVKVKMMANAGEIPYYQNKAKGYSAIGLPYKNREVMMFVVLPNLNVNLKNLTAQMDSDDIDNIVKRYTVREIFYVMPKMKLSTKFNLRPALERLNVRTLFDRQQANFTNLADGVFADEIIHQVEMEINEEGTVAAAATVTSVNRGGVEMFRADRPFMFFIYHVKVDIITFWGTIVRPTPIET